MKYFIAGVSLAMIGCNGSDREPSISCLALESGTSIFEDEVNDVDKPFLDIVSVSLHVDEQMISVDMEMQDIEEVLPYNGLGYDDPIRQYSWEIVFDLDCSHNEEYEMSFAVSNFVTINPVSYASILDFTQKNIWISDGSSIYAYDDIDVSISGNHIKFNVPLDTHPDLQLISKNTPFYAAATFNDVDYTFRDVMVGNM